MENEKDEKAQEILRLKLEVVQANMARLVAVWTKCKTEMIAADNAYGVYAKDEIALKAALGIKDKPKPGQVIPFEGKNPPPTS